MTDRCDIDRSPHDGEVDRCPNEATQMFDHIFGGYTFVCDEHADHFPARKFAGRITGVRRGKPLRVDEDDIGIDPPSDKAGGA